MPLAPPPRASCLSRVPPQGRTAKPTVAEASAHVDVRVRRQMRHRRPAAKDERVPREKTRQELVDRNFRLGLCLTRLDLHEQALAGLEVEALHLLLSLLPHVPVGHQEISAAIQLRHLQTERRGACGPTGFSWLGDKIYGRLEVELVPTIISWDVPATALGPDVQRVESDSGF